MAAVTVGPVASRGDRRAFVGLPYDLHRHDRNWTPLLRRDVETLISPAKNPFFAHAEAAHYRAWEQNWGFVPMTDREIEHLAGQLKPVAVKELVVFAHQAGKPIGFAVALPDLNVALRRNPSGRLFPGILNVLWAARRIDRVRVMLLGALPEWKGRGIDVLLYKAIREEARRQGYVWGEAGWILEDNHAMRNGLTRTGFDVYKTCRVYDRAMGAA